MFINLITFNNNFNNNFFLLLIGVAFLTLSIYITHKLDILLPILQWRLKEAQKFIFAAIVSTTIRFFISVFVDIYNFFMGLYLFLLSNNRGVENLSSIVFLNNPPIKNLWITLYIICLILSFLFPNFMAYLYIKIEDFFVNIGLISRLLSFRTGIYTLLRGIIPLDLDDNLNIKFFLNLIRYLICVVAEFLLFFMLPIIFLYTNYFYSLAYLLLLINLIMLSYLILYSPGNSIHETKYIFINFGYHLNMALKNYEKTNSNSLIKKEPIFDMRINNPNNESENLLLEQWEGKYVRIGFSSDFPLKDVVLAKHAEEQREISLNLIRNVANTLPFINNSMFKVFRTMTYLNNDLLYSHFNKLNKRFFSSSPVLFTPHPTQEVIETAAKVAGKKSIESHHHHYTHHETFTGKFHSEINAFKNAMKDPDFKTGVYVGGATALVLFAYNVMENQTKSDIEYKKIEIDEKRIEIALKQIESNERIEMAKIDNNRLEEQMNAIRKDVERLSENKSNKRGWF